MHQSQLNMLTLSRVDDIPNCSPTDAQRLPQRIPLATTNQGSQPTTKSNSGHVKNEHVDIGSTVNNSQGASNTPEKAASPLLSNKGHDVSSSCYRTPRITTDALFAWHADFPGGAAIGSRDYNTIEASILHRKSLGLSESGKTDAVVSVHDLGFSAVPWSTHHSRSRSPSQSDVFDHISCEGDSAQHIHSAAEIEDDIRHRIESNLSWSGMDKKEYLPVDSFEKIFNIKTMMSLIRALYQDAFEEEIIHKAGQIWGDETGSRRRIAATLVFMQQTSHIEDFIQENIFDHHLPLCSEMKSKKDFRTLGDDRVNTTLFQNWERVHIDLFYVYQKIIFVPFLSMGNETLCSYVFDGDVRLPWDKFEQNAVGGHGIIYRLEIHQSHHDYKGNNTPGRPPCFAVKEINGADHESYRKELRALEQACAKPYLVFEWADGNLEQFWKKRQVEKLPLATKWMARQCRGIVNAIKRIHGLATWQKDERSSNVNSEEAVVKDWGRHGDIKPTNILWFSTYGEYRDHLVVADLGLTRYHSRLTKSRVMRVDGYTGTYRAPEIDLGNPISSKYDIWSLGCVFLEFCIWYLLGYDDVENFQRDRNLNRWPDDVDDIGEPDHGYFVASHIPQGGKQAELHPAVHNWVERLRGLAPCTGFVREMLDLIMKRMLVVDPKQRYSIDMISTELANIEPSLRETSESFAPLSGTAKKTYLSPEPKSSKVSYAIALIEAV
ncbi:kinase-like domain-containing protein [Colletotrichum phormii]|uniref:Kinase-like domain-containing protein n=1 Tax=Colletotrichum phormii TaxID=359342 RepID=A0AAI9ZV32_9PEZI|nr:kinase-like domain-containing protein [Colletotrichum phormii]KAK1637533.1 kinase-like domain-containing protein [Colletotrichum phormii]